MAQVTLKKPIEHDGKTLSELVLSLDRLTGRDFLKAEREAVAANGNVPILQAATSGPMQLQLAAIASGLPVEVLEGLALPDFAAVLQEVQAFLLGAG